MDTAEPRSAQALPTGNMQLAVSGLPTRTCRTTKPAWQRPGLDKVWRSRPEELTECERTGELLASVQARVAGRA